MTGPLHGLRIVEMAGIGPGPFCGMLLADLGADVVRIDRTTDSDIGISTPAEFDFMARGKRSVALDLKSEDGIASAFALIAQADALIEGFRPGVMERLGLGPDACFAVNPRLVFGRMTGWGQTGPLAQAAGHDLNYIALTGALDAIGPAEMPAVPLNIVGDFAGGSLYFALGLLAAMREASVSGQGQVVDAAIVDGTTNLMTMFHSFSQMNFWKPERFSNLLDGGAPYYSIYECADGKLVTIGAIEAKFYKTLIDRLGLQNADLPDRNNRDNWPALRDIFAATFRAQPRAHWCELLEGTDACFAPVLGLAEAADHPQMRARGALTHVDGRLQPAPAPKFSRTSATIASGPPTEHEDAGSVLAGWLSTSGMGR